MRFSLVVAALCAYASFGALATPATSEWSGRLGRFSLTSDTQDINHDVDAKEIYVRALTKKKPTVRASAQKRQASPVPPQSTSSPMTSISDNGVTLGSLNAVGAVIGLGAVGNGGQLVATYSFTSGVGTVSNARITLSGTSPDILSYPNLALEDCDVTTTMSASLGSYVCVTSTGVTIPAGTPPIAGLPVIGGPPLSTGLETNIWSIERGSGTVTPIWVNPDGSRVTLFFMYSSDIDVIVATGNVYEFLEDNPGGWVPFTMTVQPSSV